MSSIRAVAAVVLLSATSVPLHAADPIPRLDTYPLIAVTRELRQVTDEASAVETKAKLDTCWRQHREAMRVILTRCETLPTAQQTAVMASTAQFLAERDPLLRAEHDRIFSTQKAAYAVLKETPLFRSIEEGMEREAMSRIEAIRNAIMASRLRPKMKRVAPLASLKEIANLLQAGEKGLLDPWGSPYQYEPHTDPTAPVSQLHIWTVSPYSGKKLGNPPADEK